MAAIPSSLLAVALATLSHTSLTSPEVQKSIHCGPNQLNMVAWHPGREDKEEEKEEEEEEEGAF